MHVQACTPTPTFMLFLYTYMHIFNFPSSFLLWLSFFESLHLLLPILYLANTAFSMDRL